MNGGASIQVETSSDPSESNSRAVVLNDGLFEFNAGSIQVDGYNATGVQVESTATMKMKDASAVIYAFNLMSTGIYNLGETTINDGVIDAYNDGAGGGTPIQNQGTLTIKGGSINAATRNGINMTAGTLTMGSTDEEAPATISASGSGTSAIYMSGGTATLEDYTAINASSDAVGVTVGSDAELTVDGAVITADITALECSGTFNFTSGTIRSYSANIAAPPVEGYDAVLNEEDSYYYLEPAISDSGAANASDTFASDLYAFNDLEAAPDEETVIKLTGDVTLSAPSPVIGGIDKASLTIDLAGYNLILNSDLTNQTKLTIKNSRSTGTISGTSPTMIKNEAGAELILNSVAMDVLNTDQTGIANAGKVTLKSAASITVNAENAVGVLKDAGAELDLAEGQIIAVHELAIAYKDAEV